jgi:uncharacterized protein YggE
MKKLRWPLLALTVSVVLVLGACSALRPPVTSAAPESARALGGGGTTVVNGQVQEGVVVVGSGSASADPEIAKIGFGVEVRGDDPDALVSEAAEKMDAAMAAAGEFSLRADETRTLNYNLWVETVHDPQTGRPTGEVVYHLNHQVQVTTDNLDTVGELLAAVVSAGANSVSGVNFTVEDPAALIEEARGAAVADAQGRAEHLAEQLGIALGKPLLVTETGSNFPVFADRGIGGGGGMAEQAAAPGFTPGSFSVTVNVQIAYEIR